MLLLYSPFKQEILRDFYDYCPNLFMNLLQDIINYIDNKFRDLYINDQEDNNSFYTKYCDKNNITPENTEIAMRVESKNLGYNGK